MLDFVRLNDLQASHNANKPGVVGDIFVTFWYDSALWLLLVLLSLLHHASSSSSSSSSCTLINFEMDAVLRRSSF